MAVSSVAMVHPVYSFVIELMMRGGYYESHKYINTKSGQKYLRISLPDCVVMRQSDVAFVTKQVEQMTQGVGKVNYNMYTGKMNVTVPLNRR